MRLSDRVVILGTEQGGVSWDRGIQDFESPTCAPKRVRPCGPSGARETVHAIPGDARRRAPRFPALPSRGGGGLQ